MSTYMNQGQPCLSPNCLNEAANQQNMPVYNQRNTAQYPSNAGSIPTTPFPQSPSYNPQPSANLMPITPTTQPQAVTLESMQYMNGYLRTQIGRKVTVEFLIGTNTLVDRTGTLLGVGANYILINELETDDLLICDYYTIKFVKVYF